MKTDSSELYEHHETASEKLERLIPANRNRTALLNGGGRLKIRLMLGGTEKEAYGNTFDSVRRGLSSSSSNVGVS